MPASSFSDGHGPYHSALASAFLRGVDAVILIFYVDRPETEAQREGHCLVVVGNKTNLVFSSEGRAVSEEAARTAALELH